MSNVFIFTNGGKKSQRELVEDITSWYINTKLPRYKNLNIEIDLENINDAQGFCTEIDNREFFSTYNPQEYVGGGFSSPNMLHTPVKPINITNRSALEAYYKRQGLLQ